MKKNVVICLFSLLCIILGIAMIVSVDLSKKVIPVIGLLKMISLFAAIFFVFLGIDLLEKPVKAVWKWYDNTPNPLTPKEWELVNKIQFAREGTVELSDEFNMEYNAYYLQHCPALRSSLEKMGHVLVPSTRFTPDGVVLNSFWKHTREQYEKNRDYLKQRIYHDDEPIPHNI